jgi:hypothetical protein
MGATSLNDQRIEVSRVEVSHLKQNKYWFFPETGKLVPQQKGDQPSDLPSYGSLERAALFRGSFKIFSIGGAVVLYRELNSYILQIGNHKWPLGSPQLQLNRRTFGPFGTFSVLTPEFRHTFYEWRLGAAIQKATDITYDSVDESMDNFAGEVLRLHKKMRPPD